MLQTSRLPVDRLFRAFSDRTRLRILHLLHNGELCVCELVFVCVIHPLAIETLQQNRLPTSGLRSKSWNEFARPGAPHLDFVFTVCDQAAAEVCPTWPGQPMTAHWGIPDPAAVEGTVEEQRRAFRDAFLILRRRIELLASLPFDKLSGLALQERLDEIGQEQPAAAVSRDDGRS
jgi:arsenate reductase (thioredoxin)